jgi:hypothetical protein
MLTSLSRCRACRLSWFPKRGAAAACPACGGTKIGGTLEPFHIGMALIALGLAGWAAPRLLGDRGALKLPALSLPTLSLPAIFQSKQPVAEAERAPAHGNEAQVPSSKVKSTKLKSSKVKKRRKAKKRSKHVQR